MATLKEKEQLAQDILVAQQKLDDLMLGINRAKLEKEQADSDAKEAIKQSKVAQSELDIIKELSKKEKEAFEKQKLAQGEEIKSLAKEKQELLSNVMYVEDDLEISQKELEKAKSNLSNFLEEGQKQLKTEQNNIQLHIDSLKVEEQRFQQSVTQGQATLLDINNKIAGGKEQMKAINNNVEEVTVEYANLVDQANGLNEYIGTTKSVIEKLDATKSDLDNQILSLNASITQLEKDQFTLQGNVNALQDEQDVLNKDKFELQRKIEANDRREEYIKSKYEQAGVLYS